jgi:hypothetical protein
MTNKFKATTLPDSIPKLIKNDLVIMHDWERQQ